MFFYIVLDSFYWTEGWRRCVSLLVGCKRERFFDLAVLRKKVQMWLSDSELKKVSWDNLTKSVFQSSLGLILLNWGLAEECTPANSFWKRRIFWSGCSTKKLLRWLSESELKKVFWDDLTKNVFQFSLGHILLNWGLAEDCITYNSFWTRRKFWSGCSTKVLRWLSDYELKKSSWDNLTKSVFQSSLGLNLMN